jgi:hypothetical protein
MVLRRAVGSEIFTQVIAFRGSCNSVEELALRESYSDLQVAAG